jgi:leucyl aminopeptidase (aminopeptidase T)
MTAVTAKTAGAVALDWDAMAERIVVRSLQVRRGERVVYLVDPDTYPACFESVREAVLRAGGIEQASILSWTPRLAKLRTLSGTNPDPDLLQRESFAHLDLFNTADVFIWLPTDYFRSGDLSRPESEWILARWRGRGLHFHWYPDQGTPRDHVVQHELDGVFQRAILELDYVAHARRQERVVKAIRGKRVRVMTPEGTDIHFECRGDAWYHRNDGDASREKALRAVCARDREEELPCGAVRTIPAEDSPDGIISFRRRPAWNGSGLDVTAFGDELDIVFRHGRITEVRSGPRQRELDQRRGTWTGDWDRLGEIVFGTNPLLRTPTGARLPAYWGFGEGIFRLHLGDNWESGGRFNSDLSLNLFLSDATIEAEGETIVKDGALLIPM